MNRRSFFPHTKALKQLTALALIVCLNFSCTLRTNTMVRFDEADQTELIRQHIEKHKIAGIVLKSGEVIKITRQSTVTLNETQVIVLDRSSQEALQITIPIAAIDYVIIKKRNPGASAFATVLLTGAVVTILYFVNGVTHME